MEISALTTKYKDWLTNQPYLSTLIDQSQKYYQSIRQWYSQQSLFIGLIATSLFINLLTLALPLVLLQVYDRIIPQASINTLVILILGVIIAITLETLLRIFRAIVSNWAGARFEHITSHNAFSHLLQTKLSVFNQQAPGVYFEQLNSINQLRDYHNGQALVTAIDLLFVIIFLSLIMYIGGALVLVAIVSLLVLINLVYFGNKQLKSNIKLRHKYSNNRINFLIESLGNIYPIKAMAFETMILRRYERLQDRLSQIGQKINLSNADIQKINMLASQTTMVLIILFGSIKVIDGNLTLGGLAACTILAGRVLQPVTSSINLWQRLQNAEIAKHELAQLLQMPKPNYAIVNAAKKINRGKISLSNLTFAYDDAAPILKHVNITIPPRKTIAITSESSNGKTTLLRLMLGELKAQQGRVTIDDIDITKYHPPSLHRHVAYLSSRGILFEGSILENITLFRPEYNESAIELAKALGLDDVICQLPHGYATKIGEQIFGTISAGAKQLITIARGLVTKPKIILFDEANVALDLVHDRLLQSVLQNLHNTCTMVLVTHRPSLIKLAHQVFTISNHELNRLVS